MTVCSMACVCVSIMSLVYELSSCPGVVNLWDSYTHMETLSMVCERVCQDCFVVDSYSQYCGLLCMTVCSMVCVCVMLASLRTRHAHSILDSCV